VVAELDFDETDIEELHSFLEGCEIELVDDVAPQPAAPPPDQAQVGKPTTPLDLTPDTTTDSLQLFFKGHRQGPAADAAAGTPVGAAEPVFSEPC